jgi:peroxiredoxin
VSLAAGSPQQVERAISATTTTGAKGTVDAAARAEDAAADLPSSGVSTSASVPTSTLVSPSALVSTSALVSPSASGGRTANVPVRAEAPVSGVLAPEFTLQDQHGAERSLAEELSRHPALLLFYPFAFSRVCGGELRELQSALPAFDERHTAVLAISCDPLFSVRVFAEQEGFGFSLLSDFWPHGAVARAYGVFDDQKGCARRGSFLVDRDGTVRWSVVNPISQARPLSAYLDALAALRR